MGCEELKKKKTKKTPHQQSVRDGVNREVKIGGFMYRQGSVAVTSLSPLKTDGNCIEITH